MAIVTSFFYLSPLFIFAGFAFEALFNWLKKQSWQKITLVFAILVFGIIPIVHPTILINMPTTTFFLAGGMDGVFRNYETEYWLTCYREAVLREPEPVFVWREPYIAATYAGSNITIRDFRTEQQDMQSGDYYLVNTRSNEDLKLMRDEPAVIEVLAPRRDVLRHQASSIILTAV